jgi:hypothetical protein
MCSLLRNLLQQLGNGRRKSKRVSAYQIVNDEAPCNSSVNLVQLDDDDDDTASESFVTAQELKKKSTRGENLRRSPSPPEKKVRNFSSRLRSLEVSNAVIVESVDLLCGEMGQLMASVEEHHQEIGELKQSAHRAHAEPDHRQGPTSWEELGEERPICNHFGAKRIHKLAQFFGQDAASMLLFLGILGHHLCDIEEEGEEEMTILPEEVPPALPRPRRKSSGEGGTCGSHHEV